MRASVQRLDPNLPLSSARMLDRIILDATDRPRALSSLLYGVSSGDAAAFAVAIGLAVVTAL